ncbi:MAG: hypothetical protein VXZ72_01020 [Chlamydiota bacterium]|nr:hypothetical protein [Chlamydiota bacterium]
MDKIIQFNTHDSLGRCFAESIDIMPRSGGGHEKIAGELHPDIKRFMSTLKPDPRYQYVLMTPMGAFEYWGMNVNGDIFPEISLSFDSRKDDPAPIAAALERKWLAPFHKTIPPGNYRDFGHQTFMQALRYQHHANKNPEVAYGDIVFVVYNPAMKRVECISRHDREKAKRVGAEEIIQHLDEGKPRQISMGCKVPFDVCTICGHISRTPRDYCEHLKFSMGSVMPDGRVVGAVNFFPRFFDLSDVFVPAAKESGVLMKVARDTSVSIGIPKEAKIKKRAEVKKQVLPNAVETSMCRAEAQEPEVPKSTLRSADLGKLLSTMSMLGMVMKPREFQYGALHRMGHGSLAEKLHNSGQVFRPVRKESPIVSISSSGYDPSIARMLSSLLRERSGFYPHLPSRMIRVMVVKSPMRKEISEAPTSKVLDKVASAYSSYRRSLMHLPREVAVAIEKDPEYYNEHFFGSLLTDSMTKSASFHSAKFASPVVPAYLYSAYTGKVTDSPESWCRDIPNTTVKALFGPVL